MKKAFSILAASALLLSLLSACGQQGSVPSSMPSAAPSENTSTIPEPSTAPDVGPADGASITTNGGSVLTENLVGAHFADYDSYLVLSHFKGHAMAGFGGAIKNLSIGLGSAEGKCLIHTGGKSHTSPWGGDQTAFTESMAEAGKSVSYYLGGGERIVYINVMNRISIDCDCDGNPHEPDIHDIVILASADPVALDQACIDIVSHAQGNGSLMQRIDRQQGIHTLEHAQETALGSRSYALADMSK